MTAYFLLKTEPSEYSYADLTRDQETIWDGVSNPAALKNLRSMQPGDRLLIYETAEVRSVVGSASVVSVNAADTVAPKVKIRVAKPLRTAVSLAQIKASRLFANSPLVRQGRLSVVPLSEEQYRHLADR